jgi:hypothetical protein
MSVVYHARDRHGREPVAVKLLGIAQMYGLCEGGHGRSCSSIA